MNSKSIIGYALSILGILVYILSFEDFAKALSIPTLNSNLALIIMLVLVAIGIFFVTQSSKANQIQEVPIYDGKNVVGYRRHKAH